MKTMEPNQFNELISLRLSSKELSQYNQSAQDLKLSRSEMVRTAVSSYLQKQNPIVN